MWRPPRLEVGVNNWLGPFVALLTQLDLRDGRESR